MLPTFELDAHTHTIVSGHAFGTIREMAQAAHDRGLKLLGLTEHAPGIPGTVDPVYYTCLDRAPKSLYGVELLYGSEVNILDDGALSLPDKYMKYLDYCIAGIHRLCYQDQGRDENTSRVISCMAHPKVFFISHPDDDRTPLDYDRLVSASLEHHVALEVNNSSLRKPERRHNCVKNYETMLALCMERRAPIIVDSDAHDPLEVGDFTAARALLERVGFDPELILNTSAEKFTAFIRPE